MVCFYFSDPLCTILHSKIRQLRMSKMLCLDAFLEAEKMAQETQFIILSWQSAVISALFIKRIFRVKVCS